MSLQSPVILWLLEGDPAIRWQTQRDLLELPDQELVLERNRIAREGWGRRLLDCQDAQGLWESTRGKTDRYGLYSPKWTSTTYTLLLLRRLGLPPANPEVRRACTVLLERGRQPDGGLNYAASPAHSETCVTGMVLSVLAYFQMPAEGLRSLVEFLLKQQLADGGWNCESFRGSTHGSLHTTICVLEGLLEYERFQGRGGTSLLTARERGREFLLRHKLYRSHRSGAVIDPRLTRFSFPPRWHYDVLRALDYFQSSGAPWDARLEEAVDLVRRKRRPDGRWNLQNRHSGRTWFEMERPGRPSRWNTLRALRVLKWWRQHVDTTQD